jgi:hypothetical protein
MEQIIGSYKEFIVIERKELEKIEEQANHKLNSNTEAPLSESSIEARSVLELINWIKDNNIYNKEFQIKGLIGKP